MAAKRKKKTTTKLRKGTALKRWHKGRAAIKKQASPSLSRQEVNQLASRFYQENKSNFPRGVKNLESKVKTFIERESPPEIEAFNYWELPNTLERLRPDTPIIVDNTLETDLYFEGINATYLNNYASEQVAMMNDITQRSSSGILMYAGYIATMKDGSEIGYYLLVSGNDPNLQKDALDFIKHIEKAKGVNLQKSFNKIVDERKKAQEEFGEQIDKLEKGERKRKKDKDLSKLKQQEKTAKAQEKAAKAKIELIKELKDLGFTKAEIKEQLKNL